MMLVRIFVNEYIVMIMFFGIGMNGVIIIVVMVMMLSDFCDEGRLICLERNCCENSISMFREYVMFNIIK